MTGNLFNLNGKRALITGGTQGLGLAIAKGLAEAGATVVINARNEEKLDKAVTELQKSGHDAHGSLFDVTRSETLDQKIDEIESEIGPIDILVNNAGIIKRAPLVEMDEFDWDEIIRINLSGVFRISRCVARRMIERKAGKIININSMMSELGRPGVAAYAASKGGLKMLTKNMAAEWAKDNIQVNGIGPGYFATELTRPLYENREFNAFIEQRTPAARWGDPAELAGPAVFLASDASSFVNGHILYVDGGILAVL